MSRTLATLLAATLMSHASATPHPAEVFETVAGHDFHPVDADSFTIDRNLKVHGIADPDDGDWKVRLLAVRDLVRCGALEPIAAGLEHEDIQVRYVAATALGILGDAAAVPALERVAETDPDALARSPAAVALGQIGNRGSLALLQRIRSGDESKDVRHQAELAIDQIEKSAGATDQLRAAFRELDETGFGRVAAGERAPGFTLPDTEGRNWRLGDAVDGEHWTVLIWVFADWCPVCHNEFHELIELRERFESNRIRVATLEAHDTYRARVMVGKEVDPEYWFAEESFQDAYVEQIWWPHLVDRAGRVGARYGIDPMAYAVHAEYINRPATIIVDPEGVVRFAYFGSYWGDRPDMHQVVEMIETETFDFVHPERRGL